MEEQEITSENKPLRDELGRLLPGNTANPEGRKPDTPEDKIAKKVLKELVADYKESLAEVLPTLSPILKAKALAGDIQAIKEVHDRVMGKPEQQTDITTGGQPFPIYGGKSIQKYDSNEEDIPAKEEN